MMKMVSLSCEKAEKEHTDKKTTEALGFDYMELSIDESDGRLERLLWSGRELEKLHSLSVEAGLPLMSLCLSAHRRFPLGSRDAEVRAAALEIMRRCNRMR